MKKILILLLITLSLKTYAQKNYSIERPLYLGTVNAGTATDSVLVRGADKIVKFVPRSEFLGGASGVTSLFAVTDTIANNNRTFDVNNKIFSLKNTKSFNVLGEPTFTSILYDESAGSRFFYKGELGTLWVFIPNMVEPFAKTEGEQLDVTLLIDGISTIVTFVSTSFAYAEGQFLYAHEPIAYTTISCQSYKLRTGIVDIKMDVPTGQIGSNKIAYFDGNQLKKSDTGLTLEFVTRDGKNTTNNPLVVNDTIQNQVARIDGHSIRIDKPDGNGNSSATSYLETSVLSLYDENVYGIPSEATLRPNSLTFNKAAFRNQPSIGDVNFSFVNQAIFYNEIKAIDTNEGLLTLRGNSLDFGNYGDLGTPQFRFPVKPDGLYTLTTTDDIKLKEYTVSTLPAGTKGDVAFVNDAASPSFLATVVGGGSAVVRVFYNGDNWIVQ